MTKPSEWHHWRWQMAHRIRSLDKLAEACPGLTDLDRGAGTVPPAITPYYASLLNDGRGTDALLRMCLPSAAELLTPDFLHDDPHAEEAHMPVPGLIHRYPDRAVLLTTAECAVQCRYCMRKRKWGAGGGPALKLPRIVDYLRTHPAVRDVLLSGGDPLCLSTDDLARILVAIRGVPSVDIIRIGSRVPVTLPMRVTPELVATLRRFHPLYLNTHFNHPAEITPDAAAACARLADTGIPLGNQAVLLRRVNDDVDTLEALFRGLLKIRVRPYYLFQCDLVRGVEHFRTPLQQGLDLMYALRQRLSGLAIPTFAVDAPGTGSKIPLLPEYICARDARSTTFRDAAGREFVYPEPTPIDCR